MYWYRSMVRSYFVDEIGLEVAGKKGAFIPRLSFYIWSAKRALEIFAMYCRWMRPKSRSWSSMVRGKSCELGYLWITKRFAVRKSILFADCKLCWKKLGKFHFFLIFLLTNENIGFLFLKLLSWCIKGAVRLNLYSLVLKVAAFPRASTRVSENRIERGCQYPPECLAVLVISNLLEI